MSDWQAGDKALCITVSSSGRPVPKPSLTVGRIYTVTGITPYRIWNEGERGVGLLLAEARHTTNSSGHYFEGLFRKIRPDEHEGNAEDWALLLESAKRRISA